MKRPDAPALTHPKLRGGRSDFAGSQALRPIRCEVASFRLAEPGVGKESEPIATARAEAELLADFADFMMAELGTERGTGATDPAFRERLRSRLWRMHVLTSLRQRGETH